MTSAPLPPERLTVARRVQASAATVFAVVTDPRRHVEIDGSGMLEATPASEPMRAVGDSFVMNMDREPLGDIPLGKYQVRNTVTRFEPDRLFEWNVGGVDLPPYGHVYGYLLEPVSDSETDVTLYVDWSAVPEHRKHRFPVVPVAMLERSMDNLARILSSR